MASHLWPVQMFDPEAPYTVIERRLPHWSQAGALAFITWRTVDSIPTAVLQQWHTDRRHWLRAHGIDPEAEDWRRRLGDLDGSLRREFTRQFSERWHRSLDAGHGACALRDPEIAKIVGDSLRHFDGERYELTDYIIMPNHVHLLAAFVDEAGMLEQCDSWKHFTARQINLRLGSKGRYWQQDGFDHLVRSVEQFELFRRYIANNPSKAGLKPGEFLHYSKPMSPLAPREEAQTVRLSLTAGRANCLGSLSRSERATLIPEIGADHARRADERMVGGNELDLAGHQFERHGGDVGALHADHVVERAGGEHLGGIGP
jgi:putative transposase